jgi:arylsulfatase A-like enzyme
VLQELGYGAHPDRDSWRAVAAGAWLGLASGFLEAAQHWWFRFNPGFLTIQKVSGQIFWVAPTLNLLLGLVVAFACIVLTRVARFWSASSLAVILCVAAGVFGQLTLIRKVQNAAAIIAAVGAAVFAVRLLTSRPARWIFIERTLPALLVLTLFIAVGERVVDRVGERSDVRALSASPGSRTPNVLVIVLDTARADHFSFDGYARATTPKIDRWAQGGTVFRNAWSTTSWTLPAHASLLTGRDNYEHGADRGTRLDGRFPTLGEFFAGRGYRTAAFVANSLWINPEYGFGRGFHRFRVYNTWILAARTVYGRKINASLNDGLGLRHLPVRRDAATINAELLHWLDESPPRPFFALLNYFDLHDPYDPLPAYEAAFAGHDPPDRVAGQEHFKTAINRYDALLSYLDDQLDLLFSEFARRGLTNNTIVILTADHGESLGNHHEPQHGKTLYQEVTRIPLVVAGPKDLIAARRVDEAVGLRSIPATIAQILGSERESPFPGPSFAPSLKPGASNDPAGSHMILGELKAIGGADVAKSLVKGEWQYIWTAKDAREELFHLRDDPKQLTNLAAAPEGLPLLSEFREKMAALFPRLPIPR